MSNLARQLREQSTAQQQQQQRQVKTVQHHVRVSPGEKLLYVLFAGFVILMAVKIITAQSAVYEVNKDIEDVKTTIQDQSKMNEDLSMQVDELSKYERVWKKAKELGLDLNENNVKVVEMR